MHVACCRRVLTFADVGRLDDVGRNGGEGGSHISQQ